MDTFFQKMGRKVLERWKRDNFSLAAFPEIAQTVLDESPPSRVVNLKKFIREFLTGEEQPTQGHSGFGQPELVVFDHPRFYIQMLFWMDGTTDIHQHEFSGAFHVMAGSSIHAQFSFENACPITSHLQVGDVRMKDIELLETGRTVRITSGRHCIHSLFHLDTPSITVVVRTQHDPGTGPQFNYLPPHLAMDPDFSDTLTMRRKQLLDVLEQMGDPGYPKLARSMIEDLDFERGFFILQSCMGGLQELGEWDAVLQTFEKRHGKLAAGVGATLEENSRRDSIKEMRRTVADPEHRFFLALLMNAPSKAEVLQLTAKRFPEEPAVGTVLRWAQELAMETEVGIAILDACFPEALDVAPEKQLELLLTALQRSLEGEAKRGRGSASASKDLASVSDALRQSSLRVLMI